MSTIIEINTSEAVANLAKLREELEATSLKAMWKRLTDLRVIYDNLEDQESEYAKSVLSDINAMNEAVKSQEEAQGMYYRNVGDYYRNLSKSTNQVKEKIEGKIEIKITELLK